MPAKPRQHQQEGIEFLAARPRALLADRPGLGKTLQAIRAADKNGCRDILVLCPASIKGNWAREFRANQLLERPVTVVNSGATKGARVPDEGVVIINYDLLSRTAVLNQLRLSWWDALILDEVHYLKNAGTARTSAVYGAGCTGDEHTLVGRSEFVWCLTGTPTPNGDPAELWPTLHALCPDLICNEKGRVMNYWGFVSRFCVVVNTRFGFQRKGPKNLSDLKDRLFPFMLRRVKGSDDLPPLTVGELTVSNETALKQIAALEQHPEFDRLRKLLGDSDPDLRVGLPKEHGTLRRLTGLAKAAPVVDVILGELLADPSKKIVVFGWHTEVLRAIEEALALNHIGSVYVDGSTPPPIRQDLVDEFQTKLECRVFIGQIIAAGTGLTLTAAQDMLIVEPSYVPGDNEQAMLRIHRMTQEKPCLVRFVSLDGSFVDQQITSILRRKTAALFQLYDVDKEDRQ